MTNPILIPIIILSLGFIKIQKQENFNSKTNVQINTTSCDTSPIAFLKLTEKKIQVDFFHQLDSIKKDQYPNDDLDTNIFVDITPKLLNKFLGDLNEELFIETGSFEKEYNFNIAPPQFVDSKECLDKISITFEKNTCSFHMIIYNEFFADWCQESTVVYGFKIIGNKISDFRRNEAG